MPCMILRSVSVSVWMSLDVMHIACVFLVCIYVCEHVFVDVGVLVTDCVCL